MPYSVSDKAQHGGYTAIPIIIDTLPHRGFVTTSDGKPRDWEVQAHILTLIDQLADIAKLDSALLYVCTTDQIR